MTEFLQSYGLWIALGGVFVAMHWFGTGCCGGHRRSGRTEDASQSGAGAPGQSEPDRKPGKGCH